MPKRVRPYGSAVDAESAALARGRPRAGAEPASMVTARDIASQAAAARAADMLAAALAQAGKTSAELRSTGRMGP